MQDQPLTIRQFLTALLPRLADDLTAPAWPPDMFALAMSLVQKSALYVQHLNFWPPRDEWEKQMHDDGMEWQRAAGTSHALAPRVVRGRWGLVTEAFDENVSAIKSNKILSRALLELAALADEASAGVGLTLSATDDKQIRSFYGRARRRLRPGINGSSLCIEIDKSRARVLPKQHSPSKGLTIRSLSHHLALCCADEICPFWESVITYSDSKESMNLLIVPWPEEVKPIQFGPVSGRLQGMKNMPDHFGFFSYRPHARREQAPEAIAKRLQRFVYRVVSLYRVARASVGRVDGLIFPELSLSPTEFDALRNHEALSGCFLIAGISTDSQENSPFGSNCVYFDIPGHKRLEQSKHHRWKLDGSQIKQYGLGSRLNPEREWWEHIDLNNRKLNFVSMLPWLVMSTVICEDLARPDPVGDLIRSVGPNLVVALLMDGPQIKERWPARYAATLAEDPGSSVLSLTSIGMSRLSRPSSGPDRSRVIGLWKDAESPTPTEIELPNGFDAVIVSLSVRWKAEWTADGRPDDGATGYPLLSGVHPIKLPELPGVE